jgi:hypothetical protein
MSATWYKKERSGLTEPHRRHQAEKRRLLAKTRVGCGVTRERNGEELLGEGRYGRQKPGNHLS